MLPCSFRANRTVTERYFHQSAWNGPHTKWLAGYRNIDLQHSLNNIAVPVESYIQPMNRTVSINGAPSWCSRKERGFLRPRFSDDNTWNDVVLTERLTGYSVMGIRVRRSRTLLGRV